MSRNPRARFGVVVISLLATLLGGGPAVAQDGSSAGSPGAASSGETSRSYPDGAYAAALGDHAAARDLFGQECEDGEIVSCLRAADNWRVGRGGPQDYDRAIHYADIACAAGEADGCAGAATIHFEGRKTGTPDYTAARDFYARGCRLRDPRSCAGLGNMQYIGLGGERDRRTGITNLRSACDQEFDYACEQLRKYGQNR